MTEIILFRAHFTIAWPIWAGGYPTREQALQAIKDHQAALTNMINDRLHQQLEPKGEFSIRELQCQPGNFTPVSGLWSNDYTPNSIDLVIIVGTSSGTIKSSGNPTNKIGRVVDDLAGLVSTFSSAQMPGAEEGATIYDVTSEWDPSPALSAAEHDEPLAEIEEALAQAPLTAPDQPVSDEARVFISYSHKDAKWLTRLQVHLMPLQGYGIRLWNDTNIEGGADWHKQLEDAIRTARVAILLVSPDFLASPFIQENELPRLLEAAEDGGALILPVILGPSLFRSMPTLNRYQAMNDPGRGLINMSKGQQETVLYETAMRVQIYFSGHD